MQGFKITAEQLTGNRIIATFQGWQDVYYAPVNWTDVNTVTVQDTNKLANNKYVISLCEVEVYGDCAGGKSGMNCSSWCNCTESRCDWSQTCYLCNLENTLKVCRPVCANCGETGKCYQDTGQCLEGCLPKFKGDLCIEPCGYCGGTGVCDRNVPIVQVMGAATGILAIVFTAVPLDSEETFAY
ncbi:hypothetical protein Btru_013998 [Bulinus truncatus]|nr:hypothetical protein Btru_013998 [Bulinus truncatus]